MKIINKKVLILSVVNFFYLSSVSMSNEISLPNFGFICKNKKSDINFEFIFSRNASDTEDIVYRRIDGKFKYIGNILAQKSGAYVIWEDKVYYKTKDFAWKLDKVTSKLTPLILSVGLNLDRKKTPPEMTCNSRSIYY